MTPSYQMYTQAGDRAVDSLIRKMKRDIGYLNTIGRLTDFVDSGMKSIESKHPEVYDTEPRNDIYDQAQRIATFHGFTF